MNNKIMLLFLMLASAIATTTTGVALYADNSTTHQSNPTQVTTKYGKALKHTLSPDIVHLPCQAHQQTPDDIKTLYYAGAISALVRAHQPLTIQRIAQQAHKTTLPAGCTPESLIKSKLLDYAYVLETDSQHGRLSGRFVQADATHDAVTSEEFNTTQLGQMLNGLHKKSEWVLPIFCTISGQPTLACITKEHNQEPTLFYVHPHNKAIEHGSDEYNVLHNMHERTFGKSFIKQLITLFIAHPVSLLKNTLAQMGR